MPLLWYGSVEIQSAMSLLTRVLCVLRDAARGRGRGLGANRLTPPRSSGGARRRTERLRRRLALGCSLLPLTTALPAAAQTWQGATSSWNTGLNWNPAVVPNSAAAVATFTNTGVTGLTFSASVIVD